MKRCLTLIVLLALAWMPLRQARGQIVVSGSVCEQDSITPIAGASVVFSGIDMAGDTVAYQLVTDSLGHYADTIAYGDYTVSACAEGYECVSLDTIAAELSFVLYEFRYPVRYVAARPFAVDFVRVSWSMQDPLLSDDFESGGFGQLHWCNTVSPYPWAVAADAAFSGDYGMRSTCGGVGGGLSQIEVPAYIPSDGQISFYARISSESNWDVGSFYIDGAKQMEVSGEEDWAQYVFPVTEGEHVFRWAYQKDASTDMGDDCFCVDDILFCQPEGERGGRSFQHYDLFRRRRDEAPVLLASHLSDTVFVETGWNGLSWGQYAWGVSCQYEGNRFASDTIWSVYLDKDMTTSLEVNVTTNVGLPASAALVTLTPVDGLGQAYQAVADANGYVLMTGVYRRLYTLRVHLAGYVDYVSDEPLSLYEATQVDVGLQEAVFGIDSLYVSSTGYAMWQMSDSLGRDLQHFEMRLNGEAAGMTTENTFQFDLSGLSAGDTCQAEVRSVYLSDTSLWRSAEWVYRPCSEFSGSGGTFQWLLDEDALQLSWLRPDSTLGVMLYRDGDLLGFVEGDTYRDETVTMHGEVEYCLRMVYDGPADGTLYSMSCEECILATFPAFCDPPVKLYAENYLNDDGEYGALVSWGEKPEPNEAWLHYDNGQYRNCVGGEEPVIFWSIRFDASQLADYEGTTIRKVALFDIASGAYQLLVYKGGETAPQTLLHSQNMTLAGSNAWHEESIMSPIEIPVDEPVWIVVGQQGLSRPAAVCTDMGHPDGRWVSLNGQDWTDLHTFNMHYTWMLRAFVSDRLGRMQPLDGENYSLQHYNLYRSYDNADYQQIATVPFIEGQQYYQYRDELEGETHSHFYYKLTAVYLSDQNEECESGYAPSLTDPERDYVMVDDAWAMPESQEAAINIYPNPTQGKLWISASGMREINVFNALGQRIMELQVSGDNLPLDLSDYRSGIYLVRVITSRQRSISTVVIVKR